MARIGGKCLKAEAGEICVVLGYKVHSEGNLDAEGVAERHSIHLESTNKGLGRIYGLAVKLD